VAGVEPHPLEEDLVTRCLDVLRIRWQHCVAPLDPLCFNHRMVPAA
jgi:hypothetical protein